MQLVNQIIRQAPLARASLIQAKSVLKSWANLATHFWKKSACLLVTHTQHQPFQAVI